MRLRNRNATGVLRHVEVVKYQPHTHGQLPHLLSHIGDALGFDGPNGKTTQPGDIGRTVAGADSGTVFVEIPVKDVVTGIFDSPMSPIGGKHALRIGLFWSKTGDTMGKFTGTLSRLFVDRFPFNDEGLSDMWEIQMAVEFRSSPYAACFNSPMIGRGKVDKVRLFPVMKKQINISEESWLVVFGGEVIMCSTLLDQIGGQLALRVHGVGGDSLVFQVDGVQKWNRHSDFVGLFDLLYVAFYWQETDFFWVRQILVSCPTTLMMWV